MLWLIPMLAQIAKRWKHVLGRSSRRYEEEVWKLLALHAKITHGQETGERDDRDPAYLKSLIKKV